MQRHRLKIVVVRKLALDDPSQLWIDSTFMSPGSVVDISGTICCTGEKGLPIV